MISSEELAVFDVQDVDPSYYYHTQHIDQVSVIVCGIACQTWLMFTVC